MQVTFEKEFLARFDRRRDVRRQREAPRPSTPNKVFKSHHANVPNRLAVRVTVPPHALPTGLVILAADVLPPPSRPRSPASPAFPASPASPPPLSIHVLSIAPWSRALSSTGRLPGLRARRVGTRSGTGRRTFFPGGGKTGIKPSQRQDVSRVSTSDCKHRSASDKQTWSLGRACHAARAGCYEQLYGAEKQVRNK